MKKNLRELGGNLIVDIDRIVQVHSLSDEAWANRFLALSTMEEPESMHVPREIVKGTPEHKGGKWLVSYLSRSGKTANDVISSGYRAVLERPDLADPRFVKDHFTKEDKQYIANLVAFSETDPLRVEHYIQSLQTLRYKYDGDPLKIFLDAPKTPDLMMARKVMIQRASGKDFPGVGQKIGQLMMIFFQDEVWPEYEDHPFYMDKLAWFRQVPAFPADIWMMREARQFGIVVSWKNDNREPVSRLLSDCYCEQFAVRKTIRWSNSAQGEWHIGSKLCSQAMQMDQVTRSAFCKANCPLFDLCLGIMKTNVETRSRGSLGWGTLFEEHERVFPQPDLTNFSIPPNNGIKHLPLAPKAKLQPKPPQEEHPRLF